SLHLATIIIPSRHSPATRAATTSFESVWCPRPRSVGSTRAVTTPAWTATRTCALRSGTDASPPAKTRPPKRRAQAVKPAERARIRAWPGKAARRAQRAYRWRERAARKRRSRRRCAAADPILEEREERLVRRIVHAVELRAATVHHAALR